ncbi:MAG: sigma-54-dependent Fis family transcriptional regulator [Deltaproteobacteria bacterium]|nr:sigma-54-dependent Fis family transcriptional regulator [Deltaproteobacteria bacterium]
MTPHTPKILIAEDENSLRTILKKLFSEKGYQVETCSEGKLALYKLEQEDFDMALLDLKMPEMTGFEVLTQIKIQKPELPVLLMTAQDTMKNAVEAMKQGAFDYITKPFELDELEVIVERALQTKKLTDDVKELQQELHNKQFDRQAKIIGKSRAIREVYKAIGKVANSNVSVLITGESGTGKELLAKAIHLASPRATAPFIAVNCASIPKELLESELFGYRKGAFTGADESRAGYFEAANHGTLFLDEIGDMPIALQAKLLRSLQEGEIQRLGSTQSIAIDVRILSATNQDLSKMVDEKKFREDLYFRLNVVPLLLPALREREEDIEILAQYFIEKYSLEFSCPSKVLSEECIQLLKAYPWPGNIRELENVIKRTLVMGAGNVISAKEIAPMLREKKAGLSRTEIEQRSLEDIISQKLSIFLDKLQQLGSMDLYETLLPMFERPLLNLILQKTNGNQIQAAKVLGINRNTLRKKIRHLKIKIKNFDFEEVEEED